MSWTQKELEELYQKAKDKCQNDPDFRSKIEKDANAAIEELAGRALPEGFCLKLVDGDLKFNSAYLKPDFAGGELNLADLKGVSGGEGEENYSGGSVQGTNASVVMIVSVCAADIDPGPCPVEVCGGDMCAQVDPDQCAGAECIGLEDSDAQCVGDLCSVETAPENHCYVDVCAAQYSCGVDTFNPDQCAAYA